jgi:hypothetical protein
MPINGVAAEHGISVSGMQLIRAAQEDYERIL